MQRIVRISLYSAIGLIAVLTAAIFSYGKMETIPKGVHFGNWELSGYTKSEFEETLTEKLAAWSEQSWALSTPKPYEKSVSLTSKQLGLTLNEQTLSQALNSLWEGSIWQRAKQRYQLRNVTIPLEAQVHHETLIQTVQTAWPEIEQSAPIDAIRRISDRDQVEYVAETVAYRVNMEQLANVLMIASAEHGFPDSKTSEQQSSIELPVSLREIEPDVTLASLKAQKIDRKIAEFTTFFSPTKEGRIHNIQSTANVVNDMLLAPDEVFNFEEVIKQTEQKYGFKPAPVILNGRFVPGIGGGICQVSTTLYNAALLAGLSMVERRHHSLPVQYVPLGLDATFSSGNINFRFQNHARSHLLIRTETSSRHITVKLFGSIPKEESYKIETKLVETLPPPVKYVQNATLASGQQQVIQRGKTGYIVETTRIRYENGKEQSRELIAKDHYRPQPTVIAVRNPEKTKQPAPKKKPPIIEDGVSGPVFLPNDQADTDV